MGRRSQKMINVIVDCEASGDAVGCGDLIQFAAITEEGKHFISEKCSPICMRYGESNYASIGITRAEHVSYPGELSEEASKFYLWLKEIGAKPKFWSDNPAFDWQWISWLFTYHGLANPFGFSGSRIGDFFAGLNHDITRTVQWKKWRVTPHTHDPLDDVKGNLEAFLKIREIYRV